MKIVSCIPPDETDAVPGVLENDTVMSLQDSPVVEGEQSPLQNAIETLCMDGPAELESIEGTTYERSTVSLRAPVPTDSRVLCLGGVYSQHLRERGDELNRFPSLWIAPDSAVIGDGQIIKLPRRVSDHVVPAVELGIVVGREGRYIEEGDAYDYIAGYTVCNDVTARTDWPGPMAYKLIDTFWPIGPGIAPRQEVSNPSNLQMHLDLDDERICNGMTASMRFSIPFIVSYLSSILELRPGDVISCGDPGQVTGTLSPHTNICAGIESVGTLSNPVRLKD